MIDKFIPRENRVFILSLALLSVLIFIYFQTKERRASVGRPLKGVVSFDFSDQSSLRGWEQKIFKGKTSYRIKKDESGSHLDAYSDKSASGLIYWVKFSPKEHPMIGWKWKVTKFPDAKTEKYQKGEWIEDQDFAARIYIIFPKFPFFRLQCLEYVWDRELAKDTILTNPKFENLKVIVVESGEANLAKWVQVERNIYEDFKKAFNREPGKVGAIAIMTDSDNTLSVAEAQYKDIEVGYEK